MCSLGDSAEAGDLCYRQVGLGQQAAGSPHGPFHQPRLRSLAESTSEVCTESGAVDIAVFRKSSHRGDGPAVPRHVLEGGINDGIIRTRMCDRRLPFHDSHGRKANRVRSSTGEKTAWLLPGGRELKVDGWRDEGMQVLVKRDEPDVVFFCGGGEHGGWQGKGKLPKAKIGSPACVRFSLTGDVLKADVLWHQGTLKEINNIAKGYPFAAGPALVYDNGRLYHKNRFILEALTGKLIKGTLLKSGGQGTPAAPMTRHLICIANGHVYGLGGSAMTLGSPKRNPEVL